MPEIRVVAHRIMYALGGNGYIQFKLHGENTPRQTPAIQDANVIAAIGDVLSKPYITFNTDTGFFTGYSSPPADEFAGNAIVNFKSFKTPKSGKTSKENEN